MKSARQNPAVVAFLAPYPAAVREIADAHHRHPAPAQIGGEALLELPAASVSKIERLRDVIASRGEDSAAVLRSWIESPESRKEPAGS